jgi:hypothetical protein
VELGGTALATLFVNPTVLTAVVPAAQLANAGRLGVDVTTPVPGGGTSSALNLAVLLVNPAPTISSLSPATVFALSGATLLTVTGSGFIPQSTLTVNGSAFPVTVVSSTELTASLSAVMIAQPAAFSLVVNNPAPGGGTAAATFTVLAQGSVTPTGNPQVALYSFSSPRDASVSIEFGTDTTYGLNTWAQSTPPGGGEVQILVAGMLANTTYHMRADVSFPDGTEFFDADHTFATGGLISPLVAPVITVTNPNGLTPSPGAIIVEFIRGTSSNVQVGAVDNAGNLIWYYDYNSSVLGFPEPVKPLPNGHMLINFGLASATGVTEGGTVQEIDLAGNLISQFTLADVNTWLSAAGYDNALGQPLVLASIHHDVLPLPNGHLILVVNYDAECASIPGCVGTDDVIVDALVDLDANHNPVWVWDELGQLCPSTPTGPCMDINRRPLGFPDWTHANSLVYSPDDGNLILSQRDQSWVLKIDYQDGLGSGAIIWRLGYQGDFTLTNGTPPDWFYAQHYANVVSPNSAGVFQLMVFDDGDNRVLDAAGDVCGVTGEPACYSTVPIFQVDETNMTATLLWQDNLSPVYSYFAGSAQLLNDNRVVMDINVPSDAPTDSRYMEVTHDPTPLIVLRMEVSNQESYRMVHVPSLYPGVQW